MANRVKDILLLVLLAVLAVLLFKGYKGCKGDKVFTEADTLRVVVYDTIPYYKPEPKEEKPLGRVTAKLPVSVPKTTENDRKTTETVPNSRDSVGKVANFVPDTNVVSKPDSVDVEIPITQKVYEGDNYRAFVSGYNASLDSLLFFAPKEIMTITNRPKQKRWSVGIQVGYGMTLKGTPQFAPYIGVGVQYNLFSF